MGNKQSSSRKWRKKKKQQQQQNESFTIDFTKKPSGSGSSQRRAICTAPLTIDDFEVLSVIGRGSFAKVVKVKLINKEHATQFTQKNACAIFALKIMQKHKIIEKKQVEHILSEQLTLMQTMDHPFLLQLRFSFQSAGKIFIGTDLLPGGELFFHLKKKRRFREHEAKFICSEVALALGYLHSKDIIYRDAKPENILFDADGHIVLSDFGYAKFLSKDTDYKTHTFCGCPEYMAPEVVKHYTYSFAVDWWGLGILLYELSVGIPPFYSRDVNEMYRKILEAPLLFPPHLSEPFKNLITNVCIFICLFGVCIYVSYVLL